jgi:hypothetical protein
MMGAVAEDVMHERGSWVMPREWVGERCFIICNGESVRTHRPLIPQLRGRVIAIKEAMRLRPTADVWFIAAEAKHDICAPLFPLFSGTYVVARNKVPRGYPDYVKRVCRTKDHTTLCQLPDHVCGYDSGTSAIDLAAHFGASEIVLIGMDMVGNRWCNGEFDHPKPVIPTAHHELHSSVLPAIAKDARRKGIRIVNVSPISRVTAFEKGRLEDFL